MQDEADQELWESERPTYIAVAARAIDLAADRPEAQYSIKEIMRKASCPSVADMRRLKRIARFLISNRRRVIEFPWQSRQTASSRR